MISIDLGRIEYYNTTTSEFAYDDCGVVRFEYSLKVIYEWESKWKKPFLKGELTEQELIDFYITMAIDPMEEKHLTTDVMLALAEYIKESNTATTFSTNQNERKGQNGNKTKIYTSEEIYALMFSAGVPIDFENRNLNRLMIILRIIGTYNEAPKKMSKNDILKQNSSLNAERKAKMKSKG